MSKDLDKLYKDIKTIIDDSSNHDDFNNNIITTQAIIYYPFKFKYTSNNLNRNIKINKVPFEAIEYDDFIKFADSDYNDPSKYSRSFYSLGLVNSNTYKKYKYCPDVIENDSESLNNFKEIVNKVIDNKANKDTKKPVFSRINLVIYEDTNIGFLEIYLNNFYDDIKDSKTLTIRADEMGGYAADLKKIFYRDNNFISCEFYNEFNSKEKELINYYEKCFVDLINDFDIDENICVDYGDILFNCLDYKKRAYSYITLFINDSLFKSFNIETKESPNGVKPDTYNHIMLTLGRGHSLDNRKLNTFVAEKYIYEDENSIHYCISNVSFGALVRYTGFSNFNYYTQHVEEQFSFLYEMCLHQRMYLYTVIESYRTKKHGYYELKEDFDSKMNRFNLSLVSEVEPQQLYKLMRKNLHITEITEDAYRTLDAILAKKEKEKNTIINSVTVLITIFGFFGVITSFEAWLSLINIDTKTLNWPLITILLIIAIVVCFLIRLIIKTLLNHNKNRN